MTSHSVTKREKLLAHANQHQCTCDGGHAVHCRTPTHKHTARNAKRSTAHRKRSRMIGEQTTAEAVQQNGHAE